MRCGSGFDELGDDHSFHLIEQMVPGDLFHVDSLSANGKVVFAEVNAYWRPLLDVYQGGGSLRDAHGPPRPTGGRGAAAGSTRSCSPASGWAGARRTPSS